MLDTTIMTMLKYIALTQPPENGTGAENVPPTEGTNSPFSGMLPIMVAFFAIMYFLMIRPNQKREKERREMLAALSKGDRVITNGGLLGTIVGLTEKSVVLRVSEDPPVKMEFMRTAISRAHSDSDESKD